MHTGLINVCPLSFSVVRVTGTARPHSGRQDRENVLLLATVLSDDLVMHDVLTLAPLMFCRLLAQHATHCGRQDLVHVLASVRHDHVDMMTVDLSSAQHPCTSHVRGEQFVQRVDACSLSVARD